MSGFVDLTGQRFGRLTVVAVIRGNSKGRLKWECRCDCGGSTTTPTHCLRGGHTQSCGCLQRERTSAAARREHRIIDHPLYRLWSGLKSRCLNPNATGYDRYGGRGITICDRWLNFENFVSDIGPRPSSQHSLDRIECEGDYEPGNCRWATPEEQNNNTRVATVVTYKGKRMRLHEAWQESGCVVPKKTAYRRLRLGWSADRALSTNIQVPGTCLAKTYSHNGQERTLREWSDVTGIPLKALHARVHDGWPVDVMLSTPAKRGNRLASILRKVA